MRRSNTYCSFLRPLFQPDSEKLFVCVIKEKTKVWRVISAHVLLSPPECGVRSSFLHVWIFSLIHSFTYSFIYSLIPPRMHRSHTQYSPCLKVLVIWTGRQMDRRVNHRVTWTTQKLIKQTHRGEKGERDEVLQDRAIHSFLTVVHVLSHTHTHTHTHTHPSLRQKFQEIILPLMLTDICQYFVLFYFSAWTQFCFIV